MNDRLPQGWNLARIFELCDVQKEKGREGIVPYLEIGNVDISSKNYKFSEKPSVKGCRIARKNDVLISRVRPTRGAITWVREDELQVSSAFTVLRNKGALVEKCLWQFLAWNNAYLNYLGENCTGTMYPTTSDEIVTDFEIPLPPFDEQRRIVAKLGKLLEKVDACQKRLEKIPKILKRFRQSVLAAACSGRLTADWREMNPLDEVAEESDLPVGWKAACVDEVIESLKYGTAKKCGYDKRGIPVLRIPNVVNGMIDHTDLKYAMFKALEYEKLQLISGDILVIRSNGSVSLVGKCALVKEAESGFAYAGYLIRLRPNDTLIEPEFLNLVLGSYVIRLQIELEARSTSGVNNINSEEVRALRFSLPPLAEQQEIVRRVDELFKLADQLEARYEKAKAYTGKLTSSILAKAFRGELVPQDPNDEPASVLLERIRQQQQAATPNKSKKTGKKRSKK